MRAHEEEATLTRTTPSAGDRNGKRSVRNIIFKKQKKRETFKGAAAAAAVSLPPASF